MSTISDPFNNLITSENLATLVSVFIISIVAFILDRLARRAIVQYSEGRLDTHIENSLKLLVRIIIFVVALLILLQVFGAQAEWLVSVSALGGAAIGFASTQTVGNFLAGVYLMLSQPFKVNDYVRIGDIEGEVPKKMDLSKIGISTIKKWNKTISKEIKTTFEHVSDSASFTVISRGAKMKFFTIWKIIWSFILL